MSREIKKAFHPSLFIKEYLDELEMTQAEFANRLDITPKQLSLILKGEANITTDIAVKLSKVVGTSAEFWLNLQNKYDIYINELKREKDFEEEVRIYNLIDKQFLRQNNIIEKHDSIDVSIEKCRSAFLLSNLATLKKVDLCCNYRTSTSIPLEEKNIVCRNAWVSYAFNLARKENVAVFNKDKLKSSISELRSMTLLDPNIFYPRVVKILNDCGVIFLVLPSLKNSNINGVVKWINNDKVMVALNTRGQTNDKFWFSFFHEIGHVLQQCKRYPILGYENDIDDSNQEKEADEFASETLIPSKSLETLTKYTPYYINKFAEDLKIAPGIVVGRLQKLNKIKFSYLNELKEKYEITK